MWHATIDHTLHLHDFGDQWVTKSRVDGVGALDPSAFAGRGIAMLGVSHIAMRAALGSHSSRYLRIALAHSGLMRHYFLRRGTNHADIQVNLLNRHERSAQSHAIAKGLRPRLVEIGNRHGARIKVAEVPPGPPVLETPGCRGVRSGLPAANRTGEKN